MWAYFIMPTYNLITGGPMGMFKNSTKETKEFEKIIFSSLLNFPSLSLNIPIGPPVVKLYVEQ